MKYKLSEETKTLPDGTVLHRIISCSNFSIFLDGHYWKIKEGDFGGWVESTKNLSQNGICWVFGDAMVYGSAIVEDSAIVKDWAIVKDSARISGNAVICNHAKICNMAKVSGHALIRGAARVLDNAGVHLNACVINHACVCENAVVYGNIFDSATVGGSCIINGSAGNSAELRGRVRVASDSTVRGKTFIDGDVIIENSTINCKTSSNLVKSYFNEQKNTILIKSEVLSLQPGKLRIAPVNFLRKSGYGTLTEGISSVSFSDSIEYASDKVVSASRELFLKKLNLLSVFDAELISSDYWFFPQIYNFVKNNCTNVRFLADNFIKELKEFCVCDKVALEKIEDNESTINSLAQTYIFSQFVGILLWGAIPFTDCEKSEEKRWRSFLEGFLDIAVLNLKTSEIISLNENAFAWNREMLNMVAKVCGFSTKWREEQHKSFHELSGIAPSLELYYPD